MARVLDPAEEPGVSMTVDIDPLDLSVDLPRVMMAEVSHDPSGATANADLGEVERGDRTILSGPCALYMRAEICV